MVCLRTRNWPFSSSRSLHIPCKWMGCVIMVSLTSTIRTRSPYFSFTGSASENFTPLNDQENFSICPVRCSSIVRLGSRPSGSSNVLLRSEYVSTLRPLSRRPIPGSSSFGEVDIACMSTRGLLASVLGCDCMSPIPPMPSIDILL